MKSLNYILVALTVVFFISCDSVLNRPPLDAIGEESYWQNPGDLESYIVQFYAEFPTHGNWDGPAQPREDTNSDNVIQPPPNLIMNGQRVITSGTWQNEWSNIRGVNIFFENYDNVDADFGIISQYVGEAHFFRAWFYFELVNKYGDLPWYSSQLFPEQEELLAPREPRTTIVDNILDDLDQAIEFLDYRSEVGNNRLNKEAALAFKTRVALFEGTWQKYHANSVFGTAGADPDKYFQESVQAAEEVIYGEYEVDLYDNYYELFGLSNMSSVNEVLLYRTFNIDEGAGNDVQNITTSTPSFMGVTWSLVSSYLDRNGEPYDYLGLASTHQGGDFLSQLADDIDPRLHATIWTPGDLLIASTETTFDKPGIDGDGRNLNPTGFQIKKFSNPHHPAAGASGGGSSDTGYILFRYGEVLINYAEALYELEGAVAYEVLNELRDRVSMPEFSVQPQSADPNPLDYGYSISDELYEIRRERRVELALEGRREDDYRRWAAHNLFQDQRPKGYPFNQSEFPEMNPRLDEYGRIDYFQNNLPNGYGFREDQDYLAPIPQDELALNPNLDQNPGW